ncbi:MAG: endonuclease/exonuclease/phosphatase family protein [Chloroflexi bacterium]|nr:endonuclease/exonuclease/phosphatase family protein [Chloroflexota bacterium]
MGGRRDQVRAKHSEQRFWRTASAFSECFAPTVSYVYNALIVIWFGLWLTVRDGWWWLTVINRFVPHLFAPILVILPLALFSRRHRAIAASLIPPLVFGALYWPYFGPHLAQPDQTPSLRVMTYNVLFSNTDYEAVATVILTHRPDLVALQEIQPEMMGALVERLGETYPYSLMGGEHPYGTTAVFSRYPLLDSYVLDLKADRPAAAVKVSVAGEEVTFIAAHLLAYGLRWGSLAEMPDIINLRVFEQERQAQLLVEEVERLDGTVILACEIRDQGGSDHSPVLTAFTWHVQK